MVYMLTKLGYIDGKCYHIIYMLTKLGYIDGKWQTIDMAYIRICHGIVPQNSHADPLFLSQEAFAMLSKPPRL